MALERYSWSFFDGTLSGIFAGQSFYMKEDLIFELLRDLSTEDAEIARRFRPRGFFMRMRDIGLASGRIWSGRTSRL